MSNGVYWFIYILFQFFEVLCKNGQSLQKDKFFEYNFLTQLDKIIVRLSRIINKNL